VLRTALSFADQVGQQLHAPAHDSPGVVLAPEGLEVTGTGELGVPCRRVVVEQLNRHDAVTRRSPRGAPMLAGVAVLAKPREVDHHRQHAWAGRARQDDLDAAPRHGPGVAGRADGSLLGSRVSLCRELACRSFAAARAPDCCACGQEQQQATPMQIWATSLLPAVPSGGFPFDLASFRQQRPGQRFTFGM